MAIDSTLDAEDGIDSTPSYKKLIGTLIQFGTVAVLNSLVCTVQPVKCKPNKEKWIHLGPVTPSNRRQTPCPCAMMTAATP